jgi:hypothetical protein
VTVPFDWNEFFLTEKSVYMYSAGGPNGWDVAINADADSGVLSFQGTIIDRILLFTDIICVKTKTKDHSWIDWLQETRQVYDTGPYVTGEAMETAIWQTLIVGRTHDRRKANDDYQPQYSASIKHISSEKGEKTSKFADQFLRAMRRGVHMRRLCRTSGGYIGLVPGSGREGDVVCVVRGARVPFLLRTCGAFYTFIGECYVHSIMDGEALKSEGFQIQGIKVV